ncbi:MAG: carboxypeptidase-like regulatory domain-containing protein, partial [Mucilaginibacter polytrichastri]|nr:carboxypeptidase-like regulatory domain-containing protein [Mucilaginibacter polytrichastri]
MFRKLLYACIALACFFYTPKNLRAQTIGVGKVSGKVTDQKTGETIIGATVKILNSSSAAATDVEGRYVIGNLPAGKVTVSVSFVGY